MLRHRLIDFVIASSLLAVCLSSGPPAAAQPRTLLGGAPDVAGVSSETWAPPLLPRQVASFGAARCGGWLYVYSGHSGPTHQHSLDNLSHTFSRLSLLDGKTWELLPCPQPLQSSVLLTHGQELIRIGGMSARNRAGEKEDLFSVATVARFDPLARTWSPLPGLPEGRSSHAAVVHEGKLYVAGGWSLDGDRAVWLETALVLDLKAPEPAWAELPRPPFSERRAWAGAVVDGRLVFLGGMTAEGEFTQDVHMFDPRSQAWSQGPALPFPGFGVAAIGVGRELFASGLDSHLFRLGLYGDDEAWEDLGSLVFPRYFHQFVHLGEERLLALGGVTRRAGRKHNAHLRVMEVLELGPRAREAPRLQTWTIATPSVAKNRQGVFLHHDALWVFGGNNSVRQHDFKPENFLDQAFRIDLITQRVEALPAFPVRRQSMRTLTRGGETPEGLAVGGFGHTGEGTRSWEEVYAFDFAARAWEKRELRLPHPRTQFSLVQRGEEILAFGGLNYDSARGKERAFQFPLDVLVAKDGAFVAAGIEIPQARRAFGGAICGGRYYMVGGLAHGFALIEDVDVYDFAQQSWSRVAAPATPRISPHLISLGGKLYLIGGTTPRDGDSFVPNQSVEVFDPASGAWETLIEELPISVRHMRFFPWRDRILCYTAQAPGVGAVRLLVIEP